ncbi:patatin-like phospholipase family protein [Photobacterium alginatilyticum]|uniref:patatin-like phospholipase family protein n=1 Tax=Photobacterium alginatilyticum TaxID=1775171 RepID=UPI0040683E6A
MQKIGLVLSGGGGKGPYEIGVWRAMEQLGLAKDIVAVSGTSVGALNAALFAQGDLAKAEEAWLNMSPSDVLSIDLKHILILLAKRGFKPSPMAIATITAIAMHGVFSRKGLLRIIRDYLDVDKVKQRGMPYYACATQLPFFKAEYFSMQEYQQKNIEDILLASSAIPGVFPIQEVEGSDYWDGFIKDNTPIKPVAEEGCNIIIAVMLSRSDLLPVEQYPNCKIIPIYPQEDPGAALNFNNSADKMQKGYDDAMRVLVPVFDLVETNYQYSIEQLKYKKQQQVLEQKNEESKRVDLALEKSKLDLLEELNKW